MASNKLFKFGATTAELRTVFVNTLVCCEENQNAVAASSVIVLMIPTVKTDSITPSNPPVPPAMSSGHRLRDVEQQRPLLDVDDEAEGRIFHSEAKQLWFIQDCCGMVCAFITWSLVFFADFVVTFVMLLPSRSFWYAVINGVVFNSLAVLALASHLRTMLTDPVRKPRI